MCLAVTDNNFKQEVLESDQPVLVDFWAEWCGPCRMLAPVLEELSSEMSNKVKIVKLNVDENPNTPSAQGIRGIPAMILFKNGEVIDNKVGALPKNNIKEWLESLI